jgi:hypothetical protein
VREVDDVSVPVAPNSDVEITVTHELAEAALHQGIRLPEGGRVLLRLVESTGSEPRHRRDLSALIGKARSGKGNLGTDTKSIVREEMGRKAE